jgi:hypothetical protein
MDGFGVSPLELMATDAMLRGLVYLDEFIYSAAWIAGTATELAASATVEVQIQINGDSDFIVQEQNLSAIDDSHECVDCPNLLLTIVRAGSGREIMNQAQHVTNILGNYWMAQHPARKPMSGLVQANNTLTLRLQNLSTVDFDRVDIALIGFKCFYTTAPDGRQGNRQAVFHAL